MPITDRGLVFKSVKWLFIAVLVITIVFDVCCIFLAFFDKHKPRDKWDFKLGQAIRVLCAYLAVLFLGLCGKQTN